MAISLYDQIRPSLKIHKTVYKPLEDSRMLGMCVEKYGFGKFLDLGTGTGIQGIIASKVGCDATFADINPGAVECAKGNAKSNKVKGKFVVSDMFSNIKGKFNIITFDPPYLKSSPISTGKTNPATDGGKAGRELIQRFLDEYKNHVLKEHIIFMTESWWTGYKKDIEMLNAEIAMKKHYPFLGDCVILKFQ
jgi:release factor glutamine methyltransferase